MLVTTFLFALLHFGVAVMPPGLSFSTTSVPDGQYGVSYKAQTLKVTGGKSPYKFLVTGGALPQGLSLSSTGVLSGTCGVAGSFSFTVTVTDHTGGRSGPMTASQQYIMAVDKAALKITANNVPMPYGGPMPALTVSYSGFVNGDDASDLTTKPTITTTATSSSPAGSYPITASGAADPNYTFSYIQGTLTIGAAVLSVAANPQAKAYGAADPALTYTVTGFKNGDNSSIMTGSLSRAAGENVGAYAISRGTLSAGGGYTINYTGNYLTIMRASQQINWTQNLVIGCNSNTQIQLNATASSGLPVSYSVSDPGVVSVSGNVLTLLHTGTAVVTASQAGNGNFASASSVTDTVIYEPASLIQQHFSDVIYFDNSSGVFVAWQWYKDGDAVPGATLPYYSESPTLNGRYYVVATNKEGQQVQSCVLDITGGAPVPGGIKAQPNPVSGGGRVTITCNYSSGELQGSILQVVDINGRVRQQITGVQPSMPVTMPSDAGIYIVNLLLPGGQKASTNVLVTN